MRLNVQSDYALRLLMHLAVNKNTLVTIPEVAEAYDISKNHLMKVAHTLGKQGFIDTVRGRGGGLKLARPASDINVGSVVRSTEGDFALVDCFQGTDKHCIITPACKLKNVLHEAVEAFLAVLDTYSLDQLTGKNTALAALLLKGAA